jgi:hypothetical protein
MVLRLVLRDKKFVKNDENGLKRIALSLHNVFMLLHGLTPEMRSAKTFSAHLPPSTRRIPLDAY